MFPKRSPILPRIAALLGLASLVGAASAAQIDAHASRQALEARVQAVRTQLKAGSLSRESERDPALTVAQWLNWPNWNNWNNWPNWGNWNNWVNWFNR